MSKKIIKVILNVLFYTIGIFILISVLLNHSSGLKKGEKAPQINLTDLYGTNINLENFKGKVVVLDFFAVWCPPCKKMIPKIIELKNHYKDKYVVFIGVHVISDHPGIENLKNFVSKYKINYPVITSTYEIENMYKIKSYPTMVIINKEGFVEENLVGNVYEGTLKNIIDELLN